MVRFASLRLIPLLLIALSGCVKENDCRNLSDEYFPNQVGNWWLYDRFDSLKMEKTSLRIDIIGDSIWKDGNTYKIWVFNKTNLYDTLYVRSKIDSVLFFRYPDIIPLEVLVIPLFKGQSWVHPIWVRDSTRIISIDTLVIKNEIFTDAYCIHRRLFAFNDYLTDDRWFVSYLGIVKLQNWHYLFGWISKENWVLKDYFTATQPF